MEIKVEMIFEHKELKGKDFLVQKRYITIPYVIINGIKGLEQALTQSTEEATWRIISRVKNYLAFKNPELLKDFPDYELKINIGEGVFDIINSKEVPLFADCFLGTLPMSAGKSMRRIIKTLSLGIILEYKKQVALNTYESAVHRVTNIREIPEEAILAQVGYKINI